MHLPLVQFHQNDGFYYSNFKSFLLKINQVFTQLHIFTSSKRTGHYNT